MSGGRSHFSLNFWASLTPGYGPKFSSEFCFHSISWERIDRMRANFAYALTLIISRFGIITCISILANIQLMALGYSQNFVFVQYLVIELMEFLLMFCICTDEDQIYVGIVMHQFSLIYNRVMVLDYYQGLVWSIKVKKT